ASPRLGAASDRVGGGAIAGVTLETTEEFRQAAEVHRGGGIEEPLEELHHVVFKPVARQSQRDQGVVMGPDGAIVIGNRAVARFGRGDGANAPARKEARA